MHIDRRAFLGAGASLIATPSLVSALPPSPKKERLLILGGTNYVGPHLVHGALLAGHEVTLFNRGITNVHLFPEIEKIRGDRTHDDGLANLQGNRRWDIVIDTWADHPRAVYNSARLLSGRADSYVYISSIAVYGGFRKIGLSEADPILSLERAPSLEQEEIGYTGAKRMAENFVHELFEGSSSVVRGSTILGYDYSANPKNQNVYWTLRLRAGGDVAAPGDGADLLQWSDAAALADLAVLLGSERRPGDFNAVNRPITFKSFLATTQRLANSSARLHWIPQATMVANGATPFEVVPLWIPADDPEPGFYRFSNAKAVSAGMREEPIANAILHQLKAYKRTSGNYQPDWRSVGGVPAEIETQVLRAHLATAWIPKRRRDFAVLQTVGCASFGGPGVVRAGY